MSPSWQSNAVQISSASGRFAVPLNTLKSVNSDRADFGADIVDYWERAKQLAPAAGPRAWSQSLRYSRRSTKRDGKAVPGGNKSAAAFACPAVSKIPNTAEPLPLISTGLAPARRSLRAAAGISP